MVLACPGQEGATVASIGPAPAEPWEAPPVQPFKQLRGAVAVTDVGGGHLHSKQQPQRVNQQVALAAVELLGPS